MERDKAIDILKGIGILLVLTAHSLGGTISHIAYTFHMPLFFIVTGLLISSYYSDKKKDENEAFYVWWKNRTKKDFVRLIIPALFTIAIIVGVEFLSFIVDWKWLKDPISLLFNLHPEKPLGYINIPGNLWFLFAMFFGKQTFYFVSRISNFRHICIASLAIGGTAVIIGHRYTLPFEIITGISILPFIIIGYAAQRYGGVKSVISRYSWLLIVFWGIYLLFGELRVDILMYSWFYIPDIAAATGGTIFCYLISNQIEKRTTYTKEFLRICGIYSLVLICAPTIETYCFPMQEIIPDMPMRKLVIIMCKMIWCCMALYACTNIKPLRKVFGIRAK